MIGVVPPRPRHRPGFGGDGGAGRAWRRFLLADTAIVTVVAAGWLVSLGPIPAILGLLAAKHILVALLLAGLQPEERPGRPPEGAAPLPDEGERPAAGKAP